MSRLRARMMEKIRKNSFMAMIRSYKRLANILTINRGHVQLKSEGGLSPA
jgi:hypothetical protein